MVRSRRILFVAAAVLLWPQITWGGPIRIGSISLAPAQEVEKFLPLATYLARHLQSDGIEQGKVVVARSIPQMATFFREGKVDLYIDSPFPSMAVSRLSGTKFLLRRWKRGLSEYHGVIFARKDGDIRRLQDLTGKSIAFEEPFSTAGYFLPKIVLMQERLNLVPKIDPSSSVGPREVGYVFSYDDQNTMLWVLMGKVNAGAMSDESYQKEAKGKLDRLRVIYETFSLSRHILSAGPDLPPKLVVRIKEILLTMDQSEEGRKVLQAFEKTTRFDELPDEFMARLLKLEKLVDAELAVK